MAHQLVNEWMSQYQSLDTSSSSQIHSYAISVVNHPELVGAIFILLEDSRHHEEFLDRICDQLFDFYRSKDEKLRLFVLMFLPTLIGIHLTNYNNAASEKTKYQSVEVLLLGVYNLEVVDEEGNQLKRTFRFPSLTKPSVYHEPSLLSQPQSALTEHALHRLEAGPSDVLVPSFGPYNDYDQIVACNRMTIMTVLLKVFNDNLSSVPKHSLRAVCRMSLKILSHGLKGSSTTPTKAISGTDSTLISYSDLISRSHSKIPLSSALLVELVNSVYFCMYNDVACEGLQALEEIHSKATYNLYTDVLLMTNAIRSSLRIHPSGQQSDNPMGICLALSPTSNTTTTSTSGISKTAITNASFRTRKLPDDIPIVIATNTPTTTASTTLNSINEEGEEGDKGQTPKGVKGQTPSGKMNVMQLLKDRKEKKKSEKETSFASKIKLKNENGEIVHKHVVIDECADIPDPESDTSGISETKSSYGSDQEAMPLTTFKSTLEAFGDDESNCSSTISGDALTVPLVKGTDAAPHSGVKANEGTPVNS